MLWLMSALVWAESTKPEVDNQGLQAEYIDHTSVLEALKVNTKSALKESKKQRSSISCPQRIPLTEELAKIWMYRGYAYQQLGKDEDVQLAWEQTFAIAPDIQFDETLLVDLSEEAQEDLLNRFEQIRRLVEAQGVMNPNIPEEQGDAKIFVNGRTLSSGQGVKPGEHLAQIVCPQDGLQSQWTTFEQPMDWFGMCPSGVDTAASESTDDFFDGGLFGAATEDTSEYYNPEPICASGGMSISIPTLALPDVDSTILMTMGSGVGLVLAGTGSYYAWLTPAYDDLEDAKDRAATQSISQGEADMVSQKFDTARYATMGLLLTGTALTGYGTVLTVQQVSMTPTVAPGWLGLHGQF